MVRGLASIIICMVFYISIAWYKCPYWESSCCVLQGRVMQQNYIRAKAKYKGVLQYSSTLVIYKAGSTWGTSKISALCCKIINVLCSITFQKMFLAESRQNMGVYSSSWPDPWLFMLTGVLSMNCRSRLPALYEMLNVEHQLVRPILEGFF